MSCQFWLHGFPVPGSTERTAVEAEALGFDGLLLADSQNLVGDPFVELGALTRATSRLGLGTGIINPLTRHPAVVAAAIATVQAESGGRAVLGVGRGDSSLAQIGLQAPTTEQLRRFVDQLRSYLRGDEVALNGRPTRINWIAAAALTPPPVEVAASGPTTIAMAATTADRVMLTLGADPDRVEWAIGVARQARAAAGLDPAVLRVGAYVNVACHPDVTTALGMVRGSAAIFAHFASMSRPAATALSASDSKVVAQVGQTYDEARHGLSTATHTAALDDAFVDRFAVVGPPEHCTARLRSLAALGLDRLILVPGSRDTDPTLLSTTNRTLAREVLPALRS